MPVLSQINLNRTLSAAAYTAQLGPIRATLNRLCSRLAEEGRPLVIVLEGWDSTLREELVKCLGEHLDASCYTVHRIADFTEEDASRHYLYPFWRRLPPRGYIAVFEQSWYRRVLGERVAGLWPEEVWRRAYREINQFERQLTDFGTLVLKFWLYGPDPEPDPAVRVLRELAAEEMLLKTSTLNAPWVIVEGRDLNWARLKVLRAVAELSGRAAEGGLPPSATTEEAPE